jgi:type IV fimbrial biogenesis protein FimT
MITQDRGHAYHNLQRGFTLIEVLVVLTITTILVALSAPAIGSFRRNAELVTTSNTLIGAINAARSEALKRGRYSRVVPSDAKDWSQGWVVYVDVAQKGAFTPQEDIAIAKTLPLPIYFTVSKHTGTANTALPYIRFSPSGFTVDDNNAMSNVTFQLQRSDVTSDQMDFESRKLLISQTGRVRLCIPTDSNC